MATESAPQLAKKESGGDAAARAAALERMDKGDVPKAVFDRFDDAVHNAAYRADSYAQEPLTAENAAVKFELAQDNALEQQIRENKTGLILSAEEQDRIAKVEDALRSGTPVAEVLMQAAETNDADRVRAVGKFGVMTQAEALRQAQERGDLSDEDREVVHYGKMLKHRAAAQLVLMEDSQMASPDVHRQLAAYAAQEDVPESVREFVGNAAQRLHEELAVDGASTAEPAAAEQEAPVSVENPPSPSSEGGSDAAPQTEASRELPSREAVFGREGVSREDVAGVAKQVEALLEEDTDESVFAAARQLAHLKRAKLGLSEKRREKVFEQLQRHREAFSSKDAGSQARYLTYLKYLGAAEDITDAEKERIELELLDRTANRRLEGLDQLCVQAKYLGTREDFSSVRPYLQEDMRNKLAQGDSPARVTFARARRKYLGEAYALPQDQLRVEDAVDARVADLQAQGKWEEYARLRGAADYVRGPAPVPEEAQDGVAQRVAELREQARETGDWNGYAAYVADAATLSRRSAGVTEEPAVRRAEDSEVVQFLAALEREHRARDAQEQVLPSESKEPAAPAEQAPEAPKAEPEAASSPEPAAETKQKQPAFEPGGREREYAEIKEIMGERGPKQKEAAAATPYAAERQEAKRVPRSSNVERSAPRTESGAQEKKPGLYDRFATWWNNKVEAARERKRQEQEEREAQKRAAAQAEQQRRAAAARGQEYAEIKELMGDAEQRPSALQRLRAWWRRWRAARAERKLARRAEKQAGREAAVQGKYKNKYKEKYKRKYKEKYKGRN